MPRNKTSKARARLGSQVRKANRPKDAVIKFADFIAFLQAAKKTLAVIKENVSDLEIKKYAESDQDVGYHLTQHLHKEKVYTGEVKEVIADYLVCNKTQDGKWIFGIDVFSWLHDNGALGDRSTHGKGIVYNPASHYAEGLPAVDDRSPHTRNGFFELKRDLQKLLIEAGLQDIFRGAVLSDDAEEGDIQLSMRQNNFSELDCSYADFTRGLLEDARFEKCTAVEAIFTEAILKKALFTEADLRNARLDKIKGLEIGLARTNLARANLDEALLKGADLTQAILDEAHLDQVNLSRSDLIATRFIKATMTACNLRNTNAREANFSEANLVESRFHDSCLEKANLSKANLFMVRFMGVRANEANFSEANLHGAKFYYDSSYEFKTDLTKANFTRADLTEVSMHGITGVGTVFSEAVLNKAKMDSSDWQQTNFAGASLMDAKIHECELQKSNLKNIIASGAAFYKSNISGADFSGSDLKKAEFKWCKAEEMPVNFQDCTLSEANFNHAVMPRVIMTRANMIKVDLDHADCNHGRLDGACLAQGNLGNINLEGASLVGANANQVKITWANLKSADLSKASFIEADLLRSELMGAKLCDANFNGANLEGVWLYSDPKKKIVTDCQRASFRNANLAKTRFKDNNLTGADFTGANLTAADLTFTNCASVNFNGTNLKGAQFYGVQNLKPRQLARARNLEDIEVCMSQDIYYTYRDIISGNKPASFDGKAAALCDIIKSALHLKASLQPEKPALQPVVKSQFLMTEQKTVSSSRVREEDASYSSIVGGAAKTQEKVDVSKAGEALTLGADTKKLHSKAASVATDSVLNPDAEPFVPRAALVVRLGLLESKKAAEKVEIAPPAVAVAALPSNLKLERKALKDKSSPKPLDNSSVAVKKAGEAAKSSLKETGWLRPKKVVRANEAIVAQNPIQSISVALAKIGTSKQETSKKSKTEYKEKYPVKSPPVFMYGKDAVKKLKVIEGVSDAKWLEQQTNKLFKKIQALIIENNYNIQRDELQQAKNIILDIYQSNIQSLRETSLENLSAIRKAVVDLFQGAVYEKSSAQRLFIYSNWSATHGMRLDVATYPKEAVSVARIEDIFIRNNVKVSHESPDQKTELPVLEM